MSPDLQPSVELRFGDSWTSNVEYLLRLANQAGDAHADLRCVRDVIDIVVGGDNLTAELGADGIFLVLADLLEGLDKLVSGQRGKVIIDFQEAPWELAVARRGEFAALSLYSVRPGDPVAVLDRLAPLVHVVCAVVQAAEALSRQLEEIRPGLSAHPLLHVPPRVRAHARESFPPVGVGDVTERAGGTPPTRVPGTTPLEVTIDLEYEGLRRYVGEEFDLHALLCAGTVVWADGDRRVHLDADFPLRTLRGLVADVRDIIEALGGGSPRPVRRLRRALLTQVDGGTAAVALVPDGIFMRAGPAAAPAAAFLVSPRELVAATIVTVAAVVDTLLEAYPPLAQNQRLVALRRDSDGLGAWFEELAHGDLRADQAGSAPAAVCLEMATQHPDIASEGSRFSLTDLRRMRLRTRWSHRAAFRMAEARRAGDVVVVPVDNGLICHRVSDGSVAWERSSVVQTETPTAWFLDGFAIQTCTASAGLVNRADGVGWSAAATVPGVVEGLGRFSNRAGDELVVARGGGVEGFGLEGGAPRWAVPVRHGRAIGAGGCGQHLVVGSERGFVYGIDVGRREVAWRTHVGVSRAVPHLEPGCPLLVVCTEPSQLVRLDPRTGEVLWTLPLSSPARHVLHGGRTLVLTGTGIVGVDPETGAALWARDEPADEVIALAGTPPRWVARSAQGLLCFGEGGASAWRVDRPVQVMAAAGSEVIATAGADGVTLLRAADGSVLHELEGLPPSPAWLHVGPDLTFLVGEQDEDDGDARLTCFELEYFLALVPNPTLL